MKYLIIVITSLLLISCFQKRAMIQKNTVKENAIMENKTKYNLDWILGDWKRTNDEEGKSTFEKWSKKSATEYVGLGYTMQAQDTIFKENIRMINQGAGWVYEVTGVNESPTLFLSTQQKENGFVCENKENEFPKKIEYYLEGKILKAKVSSDEMEILFLFEREG